MMMHDRRHLLEGETRKARSVRATLARFWRQMGRRRLILLAVLALSIFSAWTQVITPDLIGQTVDCYLTPYGQQQFTPPAGFQGLTESMAQSAQSNCWYADDTANLSRSETVAGLRSIIALLVILFVASALATGSQFYLTRYAGLHVLRDLRVQIFEHIHRLSLSYYARNEAGEVMSRLTNDTDTLQQAVSFALVQTVRGVLLIIWLVYAMFSRSVSFALLSMVTVPFMLLATLWFSDQARKAFRRARIEIGEVNADLQENIAGVREAQAFTREDENIARFREANAANRDANIRAVAFTSALAPALEALGYISIVVVAGVGGVLMLRDQDLAGTAISLGLIVTFVSYAQQFNQPIQLIATLWTNIQSAIAGAERIYEFLDTQPDVTDKPGAVEMPPIAGHVELRDVHMSYNDGEPVLRG
ncbi:MAG: ABC transporter ATP-binding protein, partial [Chloroflexota bacterium]